MLRQKQNSQINQSKQKLRVIYLGICFFVLFLSFSNLQNIFSSICDSYGFKNLGQSALISIYVAASISTLLTSFIVKKLGFKLTFFLCSIGYISFQISGLIMALKLITNELLLKLIINAGAFCCGFSASVLWVAHGGYMNKIVQQKNKSNYFGLFWSISVTNQIVGNIISSLVLGKINTLTYFVILIILGVISSILFLFLPFVQVQDDDTQPLKIKQQLLKISKIIKNPKYKYLIIYFLYPGLCMAFYAGYLYKIIRSTILQQLNQSQIQYQKRVQGLQGFTFIFVGIGLIFTGNLYRKYSKDYNKFKLAVASIIIAQIAGLISLICYIIKSYKLSFLAAFLWGSGQVFMQSNTGVIVSILFPKQIQGYTVSRIFYCVGITIFLLFNIFFSDISISTFMAIFLVIQSFGTVITFNLIFLDNKIQQNRQLQSYYNEIEQDRQEKSKINRQSQQFK